MTKNILISLLIIMTLASCTSAKPKVPLNENFNLNSYLGKWYEIKRFDHSFEKGVTKAEANYKLVENDKVSVVNKGIKPNGKVTVFNATAKQVNKNFLKVYPNFFPFIGAEYNVLWVSVDYRYAIVTGSSFKYLWFLSRTPEIPEDVVNKMLKVSSEAGFDTTKLIDGQ